MKKIRIYYFMAGIFSATILHAQELVELAIEFSIEAHCSVHAEANSSCFNLDELQCRVVFADIVSVCNQTPNEFPLSDADSQTETAYIDCVHNAFEAYLVRTGIDLDAPC